jgi:hypothetical protein
MPLFSGATQMPRRIFRVFRRVFTLAINFGYDRKAVLAWEC